MKRIVICFDGTWNRIDAEIPTNVLMLATGIAAESKGNPAQVVHYDEGVGTSGGWLRRIIDGALGYGVIRKLSEAYRFLIFNYEPTDEVYVFGFSRGAFTARSFVGLVRNIGIIERNHVRHVKSALKLYEKGLGYSDKEMLEFRASYSQHISTCNHDETYRCDVVENYKGGSSLPFKFRYVGIWDTVESIGFAKVLWSALFKRSDKAYVDNDHRFHDHLLSSVVVAGRHAVALDEKRHHFHSEPWGDVAGINRRLGFEPEDPNRPLQEQFFPGDHGSVGGGGDIRGLSDAAFDWVLEGAKQSGLRLTASETSSVYSILPNYRVSTRNTSMPPKKLSIMNILKQTRNHKPIGLHEVHDSAKRRWVHGDQLGNTYAPQTLMHLGHELSELNFELPIEIKQEPNPEGQTLFDGELGYHTIVKGETLGKISKKYLGKASAWREIHALNVSIISNPDKIFVGQVIRVPKLSQQN